MRNKNHHVVIDSINVEFHKADITLTDHENHNSTMVSWLHTHTLAVVLFVPIRVTM